MYRALSLPGLGLRSSPEREIDPQDQIIQVSRHFQVSVYGNYCSKFFSLFQSAIFL